MTETFYNIGVTGHRKLLEKPSDVLKRTEETLIQAIGTRDMKEVIVNTGMALGFDQLVAEVCLELGVRYRAVVPCDDQDALWKPDQRAFYQKLLSQAHEVVNVSPGPYSAWKMHARNGWIVNKSSVMIVHWDGFFQGGTGQCMKLVATKKTPYTNTFPVKGKA